MEQAARAARPNLWMGSYRFISGWEFDTASGELRRDGAITRLEPQPAALLALLASRAGDVVTHEEIRRRIWGDETHVNFRDSVHYCVRQVREALGDRVQDPQFVDTIPRRGYRFRADAVISADLAASGVLPIPIGSGFPSVRLDFMSWRRRGALACVGAALVTAAVLIEQRPNNHHEIAVALLKSVHDLVF